MKKKFVVYNGVSVIEGWPETIEAAQEHTQYQIGQKWYDRIPFGEEEDDWGADRPCHDCAVVQGQLHVPRL